MDTTKIDNIKLEDIYYIDAPDFCDAFIASADYNGVPMTGKQLNDINEDSDFVYNAVQKFIY
jgi:hypothetical protein